jgi:hypothetical protein
MSFLMGERLAEARVPVREWDRDCRNNQTRVRRDEPARTAAGKGKGLPGGWGSEVA